MTVARFVERLPNGEVRWELKRAGAKKAGAWRTADVQAMVDLADLMGWQLEEVTLPASEIEARAERVHKGCPVS
jgi:hypothetical protein